MFGVYVLTLYFNNLQHELVSAFEEKCFKHILHILYIQIIIYNNLYYPTFNLFLQNNILKHYHPYFQTKNIIWKLN